MKRPVDQAIRLNRQPKTPRLVFEITVREETNAEAYDRIVRETGDRFRQDVRRIMKTDRRINRAVNS